MSKFLARPNKSVLMRAANVKTTLAWWPDEKHTLTLNFHKRQIQEIKTFFPNSESCINYVSPFTAIFSSELQNKDYGKVKVGDDNFFMKFDTYWIKFTLSIRLLHLSTRFFILIIKLCVNITFNLAHSMICMSIFVRFLLGPFCRCLFFRLLES